MHNGRAEHEWIPYLKNLIVRIVTLGFCNLIWKYSEIEVHSKLQDVFRPFSVDNHDLVRALPDICRIIRCLNRPHVQRRWVRDDIREYNPSIW